MAQAPTTVTHHGRINDLRFVVSFGGKLHVVYASRGEHPSGFLRRLTWLLGVRDPLERVHLLVRVVEDVKGEKEVAYTVFHEERARKKEVLGGLRSADSKGFTGRLVVLPAQLDVPISWLDREKHEQVTTLRVAPTITGDELLACLQALVGDSRPKDPLARIERRAKERSSKTRPPRWDQGRSLAQNGYEPGAKLVAGGGFRRHRLDENELGVYVRPRNVSVNGCPYPWGSYFLVSPPYLVRDLKQSFAERFGMPVEDFKLVPPGNPVGAMKDHRTLPSYGVTKEQKVDLHYFLRLGPWKVCGKNGSSKDHSHDG